MFWTVLGNALRVSLTVQKTFTAVGATLVIAVGIYDFVQKRKRDKHPPT